VPKAFSGTMIACLLFVVACGLRGGAGLVMKAEAEKFLVVSSPKDRQILYVKLGSTENPTPLPLIIKGLVSPQGVCIDEKRAHLYVADPDQRKIIGYKLTITGDKLMTKVGSEATAINDVEARWCAVDVAGNLFFTDELRNVVLRVEQKHIGSAEIPYDPGHIGSEVLYDGAFDSSLVNRPGGIASDGPHLYWSNKAGGTVVGAVAKGMSSAENGAVASTSIAKNADKVYGVCLSNSNVYYADSRQFLFGVNKNGGSITTISDKLLEPRGCTYDRDGTIYVTDKVGNAVFYFTENKNSLEPHALIKLVDIDDAFGLAIASVSSAVAAAFALFLATNL